MIVAAAAAEIAVAAVAVVEEDRSTPKQQSKPAGITPGRLY
jgi:hypothetical protein